MFCPKCASFSIKSRIDENYHFAKNHCATGPDVSFKCKFCYQQFPGVYALLQHGNTQHGMQIGSATRDVDEENIAGDVEDHRLREELRVCQHFLLDSELETGDTKFSITQ